MNTQIIRLPQVCKNTALARSTIYKLVSEGTFPEPIKLTARSSGWLVNEVDDWITNRIEESRSAWGVK